VPWWGVVLIALAAAVLGAIGAIYYVALGMFRRM
jgi:hypothetical protein